MFMDNEQPYSMNVGGKLIEIWEHKYGFIPGQEQFTSRSRRRFRFGGKNPNDVTASLWILFYSRTGEDTRVTANPMLARPQPPRKYPLPNVQTKPFNLVQAMPGAAQMPSNQQQLQQQYQIQQMQQMQAQQAHMALQAQQAQQSVMTPGRMPQLQQQQQRPLQSPAHQSYSSPYAAAGAQNVVIPQKRTHLGQTPTQTAQHLPPEVVARMQRGETLTDGVIPFEDPVGDVFDALHPIDISRARFVRHHEWMEEIYSAYPASRIIPSNTVPEQLSDEALAAQIARHEEEMTAMNEKHEKTLDVIRNPRGLAGRIKAALEELASTDGVMDENDIQRLERKVGLSTTPWASATEVAISSS